MNSFFFLIFLIDIELSFSSCESYCSGIFFSKEKKLKKNTFLVFFTHFRLKVKE
jgi:predicted nucleic acid-binding Zn ribbon protein